MDREALNRAVEAIAPRFRSGNAVPVDKATVPANEWNSLLEALASAPAAEEWEKLRDPAVLHANLLRGIPAKLTREQLLHLVGQPEPCPTCNDMGAVGNILTAEPCPECAPTQGTAPAAEAALEWCVHCGEGTTGFCRSKCENRACPKGLPRPGQATHPAQPAEQAERPGSYVNAAGILASDSPGEVVRKLDEAWAAAQISQAK